MKKMEREILSIWGTEDETVVITRKGIFLVQSPKLDGREYWKLPDVPNGFQNIKITDLSYAAINHACPDEIF